jgi:hypothetical protein
MAPSNIDRLHAVLSTTLAETFTTAQASLQDTHEVMLRLFSSGLASYVTLLGLAKAAQRSEIDAQCQEVARRAKRALDSRSPDDLVETE